MKDDEQEI